MTLTVNSFVPSSSVRRTPRSAKPGVPPEPYNRARTKVTRTGGNGLARLNSSDSGSGLGPASERLAFVIVIVCTASYTAP
ncbi:hypothetical protein BO70DRAFT_365258 [Aspergillus heteromorphus CBS 117.55]|uniref:Uncharacterized protein n=1 Tax=Aspergillus heteromorphus CBS 117.55 TaxID=1448321 RepID=A0A317VDI3_9EURO|nr:uncharacterized protein BO70DRAFT_365258 [Aspergillus heteromorphus CBS 117.55]PWY70952.1 hypothetical protein BO70DRAFT_365258 [Aspergillus heteromorphus CBS 117.55]